MLIKILKCSDVSLWYNKHINEVFSVVKVDSYGYWTRERDGMYNCLNWVLEGDAEVVLSKYLENHPSTQIKHVDINAN